MSGYVSAEDGGVVIQPFTQYLPDPARLDEREATLRANFERNKAAGKVIGTLEARALMVVRSIVATPARYVEFGPYWWAVKEYLNDIGCELGAATDEEVSALYRGPTDLQTLIAATDFAEFYRSHYFPGTRAFDLGDTSAEDYELSDEDMDSVAA